MVKRKGKGAQRCSGDGTSVDEMVERGLTIDHSTIARWVLRYALVNAPIRSECGTEWVMGVDENLHPRCWSEPWQR